MSGRLLHDAVGHAVAALRALVANPNRLQAFERAGALAVQVLGDGGRLYLVGNGGSAADALHIAAELVGKIGSSRRPWPAEALVADPVTMTALANDFGYAELFVRPLTAKLTPRDLLVVLTTSGRSANLLRALEVCRDRGARSLLLCGRDPGPAGALADLVLGVDSDDAKVIQEVQRVVAHALCQTIEERLPDGERRDQS